MPNSEAVNTIHPDQLASIKEAAASNGHERSSQRAPVYWHAHDSHVHDGVLPFSGCRSFFLSSSLSRGTHAHPGDG